MRVNLAKHAGFRGGFTGTLERFGTKRAYKGPPLVTVLLCDLKFESGEEACDHLWFTQGKQFAALNAKPGDVVAFDGRITPYEKGYKGYRDDFDAAPVETDYRLSHPNRFRIVSGVKQNDFGELFSKY